MQILLVGLGHYCHQQGVRVLELFSNFWIIEVDFVRLFVTYRSVERLNLDVVVVVERFMYILIVQVFKHTCRGLRGILLSFLLQKLG